MLDSKLSVTFYLNKRLKVKGNSSYSPYVQVIYKTLAIQMPLTKAMFLVESFSEFCRENVIDPFDLWTKPFFMTNEQIEKFKTLEAGKEIILGIENLVVQNKIENVYELKNIIDRQNENVIIPVRNFIRIRQQGFEESEDRAKYDEQRLFELKCLSIFLFNETLWTEHPTKTWRIVLSDFHIKSQGYWLKATLFNLDINDIKEIEFSSINAL